MHDDTLELRWNGPLRNARGEFALSVRLFISLQGEEIHFRCDVDNQTNYALAEVWYPVLGGMCGLGTAEERSDTSLLVSNWNSQLKLPLFKTFGSNECLGVDGGEHLFRYPGSMSMPWASLFNPTLKRGIYFAAHDTTARHKVLRFAMLPGTAFQRVDGDWPTPEEAGDLPVGVTMNWTLQPYTPPGATFHGPAIVLQGHTGGWREAARIYRRWYDATFGVVDSRESWMRRTTATLDIMLMLPEDNINLTYAGIPAWAKTARDHGLSAVLISGWQVGGHDRGVRCYQPDPRLGTWDELAAAIGACHAMGLRVYFFVNLQPADMTSDWTATSCITIACKTPGVSNMSTPGGEWALFQLVRV